MKTQDVLDMAKAAGLAEPQAVRHFNIETGEPVIMILSGPFDAQKAIVINDPATVESCQLAIARLIAFCQS